MSKKTANIDDIRIEMGFLETQFLSRIQGFLIVVSSALRDLQQKIEDDMSESYENNLARGIRTVVIDLQFILEETIGHFHNMVEKIS